jgi:hypothetical protein
VFVVFCVTVTSYCVEYLIHAFVPFLRVAVETDIINIRYNISGRVEGRLTYLI